MKANIKKSERGQVLILMVVGIVALVGFTALAVDGGMVYSDRRYDQSVADASALAAASSAARAMETAHIYYTNFVCGSGSLGTIMGGARTAGINRADSNYIALDTDLSDKNGIEINCHNENKGTYFDKHLEIHIQVTTETKTNFAQLVYGGKLMNTVDAYVEVRPRATLGFGYAIVATKTGPANDCNGGDAYGVEFDGSNDVKINGGGIFSAHCMFLKGSAGIEVTNSSGSVYRDGPFDPSGSSGTFDPYPNQVSGPMWELNYPQPDCSSVPNRGSANGGTIYPGRYTSIGTGGGVLNMKPGLYCVSNGFGANNGEIYAVAGDSGQLPGVTIFITGGNYSTGGNVKVNLIAPTVDAPPAIKGMLIMTAQGVASNIDLRGTSDSWYYGTVYSPDGNIDAGGNSSDMKTLHTQLIAQTVKVHGNVTIDINFLTSENFSNPATIDLSK